MENADTCFKDVILNKRQSSPSAKWYVNVTNGIEAIPILESASIPYSFVSIQSTHLEQKHFDLMLRSLGANFLINLALGVECVVVDYGANKLNSRAIYQGLPFIKYTCEKIWYKDFERPYIISRNNSSLTYDAREIFKEYFNSLDKKTRRCISKYKEYSKLNDSKRVSLTGLSTSTTNDGNAPFYSDIVNKYLLCHI